MKLKITVDGQVYEVEVEAIPPEQPQPGYVPPLGQPETPVALGPASPAVSKPPETPVADEAKVCRTPINGVVVRVAVKPGQEIQPQELLLVLEAMKMETEITSPVSGKVSAVHASPGDSVKAGQVLVEFE